MATRKRNKSVKGVLQMVNQRAGFLRDPDNSFQPSGQDVYVTPALIQEYGLVEGVAVEGTVEETAKGRSLVTVKRICGITPAKFRKRTPFTELVAIDPIERYDLGHGGNPSMRSIDLIAPIGKGTRGLIVAQPKSGKTLLLEQLANAIHESDPKVRIIMLLIDERPEEVTHFRRAVQAQVLASSNDQEIKIHVGLAELTMAHVRCELECGHDIVLLVDSITRLARAFNLNSTGARRTMSGGIDAKALEIPRRFFGLARNIEKGGSVTVIATTLVGTGSRMDDFIFEEFKSTGNSEIVLDRTLAEARIFPAMDLLASSTRRDELLYSEDEMERLNKLRRWLAGGNPKAAMTGLLKLLDQTKTNDELLRRINL